MWCSRSALAGSTIQRWRRISRPRCSRQRWSITKAIESGRASFSAYSHFPSQPANPDAHQMFLLVPDGVARVVVFGRGKSARRRLSATVHGNVAIFYTAQNIYPPRHMHWYGDRQAHPDTRPRR
jgi:hypothetical protein